MRVTHGMTVDRIVRDLRSLQGQIYDLQSQASSGRRLQRLSDDPVVGSRLLGFDLQLKEMERYQQTGQSARDWIAASESALQDAGTILARARELAISGAGVNDQQGREAMVEEVDVLLDHLLSVANASHRGRYLFGGTETLAPPHEKTSPTAYTYVGDNNLIKRQIGPDASVRVNETGQPLFSDAFTALVNLRDALQTGDAASLSTTQITEIDASIDAALQARSRLGAEMRRTELAEERFKDLSLHVQGLASELGDADLAEVLVRLRSTEISLQAALAAGARMIQTSLVDFLR